MKYIVYKRTSPSGHCYIGYTSLGLMERWEECIKESRRKDRNKTPLHLAIIKYGAYTWNHEILFETDDKKEACDKEIEYVALYGYYNIAKGGTGGLIGTGQLGKRWKVKDTSNMKGPKNRDTEKVRNAIKKMSHGDNYQCQYHIITPWGNFDCKTDATRAAKELENDNKNVLTDGGTLTRYLLNLDIPLNIKGRRTPKEWRGKTPREIGFDYIQKGNHNGCGGSKN